MKNGISHHWISESRAPTTNPAKGEDEKLLANFDAESKIHILRVSNTHEQRRRVEQEESVVDDVKYFKLRNFILFFIMTYLGTALKK